MPLRRIWRVVAALVLTVSVGSGQLAHASNDSLTDRVEAIVRTVTSGSVLKVVITTVDQDGTPHFDTTLVSTLGQARSLVRAALSSGRLVSMAQPVSVAGSVTRSNDTYRPRQWALNSLRAEEAWTYTQGGAAKMTSTKVRTTRVTVAVLDTGVATDHRDLKGNVTAGYNAIRPSAAPYDDNGHGTHVAGIIAAVANNRSGIAGLAPRATVMPVKVLDRNGSGTTDDVARGVVWAVDHGAKVINLSLSGTVSDPALQQAVTYAQKKGALVVAAAGNSGTTQRCALLILLCGAAVQYPAAYSGVVGVGSIDADGSRSSFSSVGSWVDVVAPGGSILSLAPRTNRLGCGTSTYCTLSGTSMAAPYVSAAAALTRANPAWTASRTAQYLQSTAGDLGPRGRDDQYGAGLINPAALAKKAIRR